MSLLRNDSDQDWKEFGKTNPYFAVLTNSQYEGELSESVRANFFASGEAHIEAIFSVVRTRLDPDFAPLRALDFGCGVGRLLIPLASRSAHVTGVDISPAMLAEARKNCDAAGATGVELFLSDDELSALTSEYDLIHSYIVLQHIPVHRGENIVRALARKLAPKGVGVFHVTYSRVHPTLLSSVLYWARTRVPGAHLLLNVAMGRAPRSPVMQINRYSVTQILDILALEGCTEAHVRFSNHDGNRGVLLFARKGSEPVFSD